MAEDTEDLFVIDKQGGSESPSNSILYHFKPEEDPNDTPDPEPKPPRQRRGPTGKRYHESSDFTKYRPGKLSNELREALDLAKHQIPIHVYRMRTLGYPPGWLRKARVGGELTIFDSATVLAENEEVIYNRDALVSYPGFNTELEYPSIDQCHQLNCPPMQSHHMLDNFYAALSRTSRMSYDGNGQLVPKDLEKLRLERERILAEIRLLDSKISSRPADESGDTELPLEDKDQQSLPHSSNDSQMQDRVSPPSEVNGDDEDSNSKIESNDSNSQLLAIGALEEGTPTPSRPYRSEDGEGDDSMASGSRPSIDAFTVGVQPFRPFENLPGTQGGYQRVLKTLRRSQVKSSTETPPPTSAQQQYQPSGTVNTPILNSGSQHLKASTPHGFRTTDRWSRESRSFDSASSFSSASWSSHFHSSRSYPRSERRHP